MDNNNDDTKEPKQVRCLKRRESLVLWREMKRRMPDWDIRRTLHRGYRGTVYDTPVTYIVAARRPIH